jgi:hypothetical protein
MPPDYARELLARHLDDAMFVTYYQSRKLISLQTKRSHQLTVWL